MCDEAGGCRDFTGNFRRVCPTLNRARAFWNLIFDALDIAPRAASIRFEHKCRRKLSGFYLERVDTPGRAFRRAETRTARAENVAAYLKILNRRQKTVATSEKIRIRLKSYDHTLIDAAAKKIVETAKRNGSEVSGPIPLPTEKEIVTILRAVHKYKDSREQFEIRTHKRLIDVIKPSQKTIEALTGLELPAGVEIEIKL